MNHVTMQRIPAMPQQRQQQQHGMSSQPTSTAESSDDLLNFDTIPTVEASALVPETSTSLRDSMVLIKPIQSVPDQMHSKKSPIHMAKRI